MNQPSRRAGQAWIVPLGTWTAVDRHLAMGRDQLANGEYRDVGVTCDEVLLLLALAVYVRDRHEPKGGPRLRLNDPRGLLEAFIAVELATPAHEGAKSMASSALENCEKQTATTEYQSAAICLETTSSLVKYVEIAAGRRTSPYTVADLCNRYLETAKDVGATYRYGVQMLARQPIGTKVASQLTAEDVVEHCQRRRNQVSGATVTQDVVFLRAVLKMARDEWKLDVSTQAIDQAKPLLQTKEVLGRYTRRRRRPTREEFDALIDFFRKQDQHHRTEIPMAEVVEFAVYSARRISEICELRWADLNEKTHTCMVRGVKGPGFKQGRDFEFPLLGKAWDIVQRQPKVNERIFPYNPKSAGQRYTLAKKKLGINDLTFQDLRREAAKRLAEAGHSVEQISKVTGRLDLNSLQDDINDDNDARFALSA